MDFSALIFEPVLLVEAVAEIDFRAVPEPNFILDDGDEPALHPAGQQFAKAARAFHVVLDQILMDAPEEIDLKARDFGAPEDGSGAHQMRFAATGRATE
ncbi:hypothetical protein [Mesorhizobium sp. B2-4-15]|uniref:hypothetical protein n=1 Tax=Mesorhizobium sp. B2-4-15 TaxID=2589934 RepID=UPI0032B0F837